MCKYHKYRIVDLPGTDSIVDQMQHLSVQKSFLKQSSFTTICLVCEINDRHDTMIVKLSKIKNLFRRYVDNMVVILTKCDSYTSSQKRGCQESHSRKFEIVPHLLQG